MLSLDRILVARDFSSVSNRALRHGLALAARTHATLHVLYAEVLHEVEQRAADRPSPADGIQAFREELKAEGGVSSAALDNVSIVEAVRRDTAAAPAILGYASEEDIDLIALGTHGRRGPRRIVLGSVAEEVVRHAPQPVLTVRGTSDESGLPAPRPLNRILVPVDFSEYAREALVYAREWARLYDAEIDVLHVVEEDLHPAFYVGGVSSIYDVEPDLEEKVSETLNDFVQDTIGSVEPVHTHMRTGSAGSAIVEFADNHDVDLVSLSTHGRTGLERFLLGSIAEKVVRHVHCPVLTVKTFGHSIISRKNPADTAASA